MILAGDIGGTKTNLGLFDVASGTLSKVTDKRYPSREHAGLEEIVKDFLSVTGAKVSAASFGIAGPVVDNQVHAGNLPWVIDGATMAKLVGLPQVRLMNDLEAAAHGIAVMRPQDLEMLYVGVPDTRTHRQFCSGTARSTSPWPPRPATRILRRTPSSRRTCGDS
jgi:glucokinase